MAKTRRKEHSTGRTRAAGPSPAYRLGSHITITAAAVVTDLGVGFMTRPGAAMGWVDVARMAAHALGIGAIVFLWLPLSARLAARTPLPAAAAEGLMVAVLGLLVAGIEFGLLRGPDRVGHTVVAVVGMLAGWAMRIPPPQPEEPPRRR